MQSCTAHALYFHPVFSPHSTSIGRSSELSPVLVREAGDGQLGSIRPNKIPSKTKGSDLTIGDGAEAGCQAVPAIDGNNGQRQVDQFFVGKILAYLGIDLVWHVVNGNQGHCLRPCQSCPLTLGIERSLAPGNEFIETLFGFAARPRGFSMQIDSIRAPVELRRANFDKLDQQRLLAGKIG